MNGIPYRTSFWSYLASEGEPARTEPLRGPSRADVAIVGGGIIGLSCAYYLKQSAPGLKVALLEAEYVGFGASGRNFGALTPTMADWTGEWADQFGYERGRTLTQFLQGCIVELERVVAAEGISCGFSWRPLLFAAFEKKPLEAMRRSLERYERLGNTLRWVDGEEMSQAMGCPALGGISLEDHGLVQPYLLCRGLREAILRLGVRLYEDTRVTRITPGPRVEIETEGGAVVADKVVMALNAYSGQFAFMEGLEFPGHTYVLATALLPPSVRDRVGRFEDETVLDYLGSADRSAYYQRFTRDGRYLLGGGGGVPGGPGGRLAPDRYDHAYRTIHGEMVRRYPALKDIAIEAAWGGPICVTRGHLPLIGPHPSEENVIVAIVGNGRGLCLGSSAGRLVKAFVLGEEAVEDEVQAVLPLVAPAQDEATAGSGEAMILARYTWRS